MSTATMGPLQVLSDDEQGQRKGGLRPHMYRPLLLLSQAYDYSHELSRTVWEFAVEIGDLRAAGLSNSDLRWLLVKGYIQHAEEIPLVECNERHFTSVGSQRFTDASCFVITPRGQAFVLRTGDHAEGQGAGNGRNMTDSAFRPRNPVSAQVSDTPLPSTPYWDRDRRELRLGELLVKRFRGPAQNQGVILDCFQEEDWPARIDDPLSPRPEIDTKRRLHDTINSLNRNQKHRVLCFQGDGSGTGILWEVIQYQADNAINATDGNGHGNGHHP